MFTIEEPESREINAAVSVFRTTNNYFYWGEYGGIAIDGVRTFDSQRYGAGVTWKFGNQKVKSARKSRGAMDEELKRLEGSD